MLRWWGPVSAQSAFTDSQLELPASSRWPASSSVASFWLSAVHRLHRINPRHSHKTQIRGSPNRTRGRPAALYTDKLTLSPRESANLWRIDFQSDMSHCAALYNCLIHYIPYFFIHSIKIHHTIYWSYISTIMWPAWPFSWCLRWFFLFGVFWILFQWKALRVCSIELRPSHQ